MNKPRSLKKRLIWQLALMVSLLMLLSTIGTYYGTKHEADEIFSASLVQTAKMLDGFFAVNSIDPLAEEQAELVAKNIKQIIYSEDESHEYEKELFYSILDENNDIVFKSEYAPDLTNLAFVPGFQTSKIGKNDWYLFSIRSQRQGFKIIVGEMTEIRAEMIGYIAESLLLPTALLLPLFLIFHWKTISLALKPLELIANQVAEQDLDRLVKIDVDTAPQEVNPLILTLNQMMDKLGAAFERQRRFVSDASHELRNPLASMLINVENALEEHALEEKDKTEVADSLGRMKKSIIRLSHLVSQLLELSHSENPNLERDMQVINLLTLCKQTSDSYRAIAEKNGQTLTLDLSDQPCVINGSMALVTSLISNLIDNAIKYSHHDSQIWLRCRGVDQQFILTVEDSGPGLEPQVMTQVMKRFYRAGNDKSQGAGLGLSIAQSIAEIHQAKISIEQSQLGGLSVSVVFGVGDQG